MRRIVEVRAAKDYRLEITFDDGVAEVVDVKPLFKRQAFEILQDEEFFRQVKVDEKFDGVKWPNGLDICVDWIEAEIGRQGSLKMGFA